MLSMSGIADKLPRLCMIRRELYPLNILTWYTGKEWVKWWILVLTAPLPHFTQNISSVAVEFDTTFTTLITQSQIHVLVVAVKTRLLHTSFSALTRIVQRCTGSLWQDLSNGWTTTRHLPWLLKWLVNISRHETPSQCQNCIKALAQMIRMDVDGNWRKSMTSLTGKTSWKAGSQRNMLKCNDLIINRAKDADEARQDGLLDLLRTWFGSHTTNGLGETRSFTTENTQELRLALNTSK